MTRLPSSRDPLLVRFRQASSRELGDLVAEHGHRLELRHIRQILNNPFLTESVIEELASHRRLTSVYEIKAALCRHPRTPQASAMRFVSSLFWRDLMEITADVRIRAGTRTAAEKYLILRLPRLSVGEKTSLARRATANVLAQLGLDPDPRVIAALLQNPRLTESSLEPVVARSNRPRHLQLIAEDPRWGSAYRIRVALSLNPLVPFRALFRLLPDLKRDDLQAVADLDAHSTIVRERAREILESRRPAPGGAARNLTLPSPPDRVE